LGFGCSAMRRPLGFPYNILCILCGFVVIRFINKKSVGVEAAQISPKLSMSQPRLFPDTNACILLPKNRPFVNENLKFMDVCCL